MIGSILISPECLPVAAGILSPGDFGLEANRQLFQAALALTRAGKPADPVLLGQEARRMGGSVSNEYILQLMDTTPTAANVEEYARLTRENAVARGVREMAQRCLEQLDRQTRPRDILEETARTLEQLEQQGTERELISPQEGMLRFYQHREARVLCPRATGTWTTCWGAGCWPAACTSWPPALAWARPPWP